MKFAFVILILFTLHTAFAQSDSLRPEVDEFIRKEYQKVIDKAFGFFETKEYNAALDLYIRASSLNPEDLEVKLKIEEIQKLLDPNCYGNTPYETVICKADAYYASENYICASQFYNRAMMLNPSEAYPAIMIEKINAILKSDL